MSLPGGRGVRAAGGLRAAWEQQQQAAQLAAVVGRMPHLGTSKPAFFAAQLLPVLAALRQAAAAAGQAREQRQQLGEAEDEACRLTEGGQCVQLGQQPGPASSQQEMQQVLAAAAAHLRRLQWVDCQGAANAGLLLWLLLGLAGAEEEEAMEQGGSQANLLAEPLLLWLFTALGWQALLLEALPLLPVQQRQQLEAGLVAAATATASAAEAEATAELGASEQQQEQQQKQQLAAVQELVERLAAAVCQELERYSSTSSSSSSSSASAGAGGTASQGLLAGMALLQQLLLECPAAAAARAAAAALRRLLAVADACRSGLMQEMQRQRQEQGEVGGGQQALFQQLCQLGARLMLSLAAADSQDGSTAASATPTPTGPSSSLPGAAASEGLWGVRFGPDSAGSPSQTTAAQAWSSILHMPPRARVAAAAAPSDGCARQPNRLEFLAACVAARCYLQGSAAARGSFRSGSADSGSIVSAAAQRCLAMQSSIPALPGVCFHAPVVPTYACQGLPLPGTAGRGDPRLAAAAQDTAADVLADPDCLSPVHLTLASLQLAELVGPPGAGDASSRASEQPDDSKPAWAALLDLATAAAAAAASEPRQQQALLLLALHGQQPWQCRLRAAAAADAELQQRCRRQLVGVANRLASDASRDGRPGGGAAAAGPAAAATVHGEARRKRTAAAVAVLLPHALLCPSAVLERVVQEALVQQGGQVELLLDVLREMRPLALCPARARQGAEEAEETEEPLLLDLLARLLGALHGGQQQQAEQEEQWQQQQQAAAVVSAALGTPGSRAAILQLVAGLCGVDAVPGARASAASMTAGSAGEGPLLNTAAVMRRVVVPALQGWQRRQQRLAQQRGAADAAGGAGEGLQLMLQLAELLLRGANPAAGTGAAGMADEAQAQEAGPLSSLQPLLLGLMDCERRRVDRSAVALAASLDTLDLAATLLQRFPAGSAEAGSVDVSSSDSSPTGGSRGTASSAVVPYFQLQLLPLMQPPSGGAAGRLPQAEQRQQVQRLRRAILQLLAALLPCCTAGEAGELLAGAVPGAIQSALLPSPPPPAAAAAAAAAALPAAQSSMQGILAGAHAAAVEAARRAAQALALRPDQAPIAGEQPAPARPQAGGRRGSSVEAPSTLRQLAVERTLQHLTKHCARLAAAPAPLAPLPFSAAPAATPVAGGGEGGGLPGLSAPEAQALALRCFSELCQLAAALQPAGYDCATLQAGLLQLVRLILPQQAPGAGLQQGGQQQGGQQQQQGSQQQHPQALLLSKEQVVSQLGAAAGVLPEGRLLDVVRLALAAEEQQP